MLNINKPWVVRLEHYVECYIPSADQTGVQNAQDCIKKMRDHINKSAEFMQTKNMKMT